MKGLLWERWAVLAVPVWLRGWVLLVLALLPLAALLARGVLAERGLVGLVEPGQVRAKLLAKLWLPRRLFPVVQQCRRFLL